MRRSLAVKRVVLAGLSAFLSISLWTGAPLLALWVGSLTVGETTLSMRAVVIVVLVLAALLFAITFLLVWLNGVYRDLTGLPAGERRARWLRSMRAEREGELDFSTTTTTIERIVVASVYLAVISLLVWFFFIAGSPLPH